MELACNVVLATSIFCLLVLLWFGVQQCAIILALKREIARLHLVNRTVRGFTSFHYGDVAAMEWRRRKDDPKK